MAGYAHDYSKSNNAVDAEARGLMTATQTAQHLRAQGYKGTTAKAVSELVPAEEWHHSSKMYNRVNYYDPRIAEEVVREHLDEWKQREKTQHNHKPPLAPSHEKSGVGERAPGSSPSTPTTVTTR